MDPLLPRSDLNVGRYVHPLDAVVWQDMLLQSYRSIQIITQMVFIAVGMALTLAIIVLDRAVDVALVGAMFVAVSIAAQCLLRKLAQLIRARGDDVYYWQRELLTAEQSAQLENAFCRFKAAQLSRTRGGATFPGLDHPDALTQEQLYRLVEAGSSKTRVLVERTVVRWLTFLWLTLAVVAAVAVYSKWR